jgi:hypothetical protein
MAELKLINERLAAIEARLTKLEGNPPVNATLIATVSGTAVEVRWSSIPNPTRLDWIRIYPETEGDTTANRPWAYTSSCNTTAGSVTPPAGLCNINIGSLVPGRYQARYFTNDTYTRVVVSMPFNYGTVSNLVYVEPPSNEQCYTSTMSEQRQIMWDTDGPGDPVDGYHLFIGTSPNNYDLPTVDLGVFNIYIYDFIDVQTRCFRAKGYVMK